MLRRPRIFAIFRSTHTFGDYVPACTFEGDNWVLFQQTARYLLKSLKAVRAGKQVAPEVSYLQDYNPSPATHVKTRGDFLKPIVQLEAYRHRAARLVVEADQLLEKDKLAGKLYEHSWNTHMIDVIRAARAHTQAIMLENFVKRIPTVVDLPCRTVLKKLCDLWALWHIESPFAFCSSEFVEDSYFNSAQIRLARDQVHLLCDEIRPDAVPLSDSWNFSDAALESALGRFDGNVYENMYNWALQTPLNKEAAKNSGVDVRGYQDHVKKVLTAGVPTEPAGGKSKL